MNPITRYLFASIALASCLALDGQTVSGQSPISTKPPLATWEIPSTNATKVQFPSSPSHRLYVIAFMGVECPLALQYGPRLEEISDRYRSRSVAFLGVNSNLQDSMEEVRSYVAKCGIEFPFGKDYDQKVADALGATRTPEVVILDAQGLIWYRGRIDDQFQPGIAKPSPTSNDLCDALDALLEDQAVPRPLTEAKGCLIGRPRKSIDSDEVTYTKQIAGIFSRHCIECHRDGEIGPFAMADYDEIRGWGDMIVETIDQGRMPPWHASDRHRAIKNARHMPESEKLLVRKWVSAGMPYGEVAELPKAPPSVSGWRLPRDPELVVAMRDRPFRVPDQGTVEYQYFVVDPGLQEDRWVSAAQVIPGNASVVHHAIVFIRPPDTETFRGTGWLTAYVPGQRSMVFPPGMARRIPAGSKFVFQMHYTPNGRPQEDITKVGLIFTDESEVREEVFTLIGIDQEFEIPPHAEDHPVTARVPWLPPRGKLLAVAPHMHVRGKSFELFARSDGELKPLLEVPRYDFNWQHTYELSEPLELDTIEGLEFVARFDNSKSNPVNPNPDETVCWGDQTWEEMAVSFFEVAQARSEQGGFDLRAMRGSKREKSETANSDAKSDLDQQKAQRANQFADSFLRKLDHNGDGVVTFGEAPLSVQRYSFWRFDKNHDNRIERHELLEVAN